MFTIDLNNIAKVYKLVNTSQNFTSPIYAKQGHYCVNAKSLLGVLSLDLTLPVCIEIYEADFITAKTIQNDIEEQLK